MKHFYLASLVILFLSACEEKAQPYEENNLTKPTSSEKGYIQTH